MDKDQKEMLLSWLNDAYSMEQGLIPILENHVKDAENFPQLANKLQEHIGQTRNHAEMVKGCIERLGGDVSKLKEAMGKFMGMVQSVSTAAFHDEVIKDSLSDYAAEQFEVASYTALVTAAEQLGDMETANVCRRIMQEDADMASWLHNNLPVAVRMFMQQLSQSGSHTRSQNISS